MVIDDPYEVNVLLAAYNESFFCEDAIESLVTQSFQRIKIVIVNDCSTDGTDKILHQLAQKYPRKIILHHNQRNLGLAASLNIGSKLCTAKYIARMDADDICKPTRLQKQFEFLEAYPDIALVSGAMEYIDKNGTSFGRTYPITSPQKICKKIFNAGNVIVHPAVMMRRDTFKICGGYCEGLTTAQDYHLWMKFLRRGYKLAMLPAPMISYRVRGKAISNRVKTEEQVRLMKKILEYDDPPVALVNAFRKEVEKNKGQFVSSQSRKARIENSMHCKIWRMSRKLRIPEKVVEKVVCGVQNF
jgi:glycosyltransferase EpsE